MLLGNILKENRERLGMNIEQVSQQLSIPERYLTALEENNFDVIPGDYYVKDFVTKYAGVLGLNAEQLLLQLDQQRVQAEQAVESAETVQGTVSHKPTKPVFVTPVAEVTEATEDVAGAVATASKGKLNVPRIILAILGLLLLLALAFNFVLGSWNKSAQQNTSSTETTQVTTTDATTNGTSSDESASSVSETTTGETTKESTTETTQTTTTAATTTQSQTTNAAAQQQTTAAVTQAVARGIYTISNAPGVVEYGLGSGYAGYTGQHRLTLRVTEPTWVSIAIHGKTVYERIAPANATIPITANHNASDVTVRLGISSGASLTLDDQFVPIPTASRVQTVKINLAK